MHTLPRTWTRGQWTYTQVRRQGDIAIYRQRHSNGTATRYEVIIAQRHDERAFLGTTIEAGEFYPASAAWGTHGYTCFSLAAAERLATVLARKRTLDG